MSQFHSVNFSGLPQNSSLASTGYEIVYTEARNHLKRSNMSYVLQRAFRDTKNMVTTQLFFVNSFGNAVFRVATLVNQSKRQVDQSI